MSDRDRRIREEAYRIWVETGRPEGEEREHWLEAERRVSANEGVEKRATAKLNKPDAQKGPSKQSKEAAGAIGAAPNLSAGKSSAASTKEAEAFAQRRAKKGEGDVEGARSAPAPGPAGAKPKLEKAGKSKK